MDNRELFYFLGKCLALGENKENYKIVIEPIKEGKVDWGDFVAKASDHLVLPSVFLRFKQHGILPFLPDELEQHLQMVYELNHHRNTEVLKQINRINQLLATIGVVPVYLKGAGNLLDGLYEDVGERMMGDIDLLVSESEFLPVAMLLKENGYEHHKPFFEDEPEIKHFPRMLHPEEPVAVEVHRVPVDIDLAAHMNYAIIDTKKRLAGTDPPCHVLSDGHKVVMNFLHGFMAKDIRLMHMANYRTMTDFLLLSHRTDVYGAFSGMGRGMRVKAFVYADYVHHALGLTNERGKSFRSKLFIMERDLYMSSKLLYKITGTSKYLFFRFGSGYVKSAIGVFSDRKVRKSVFRRLSDPTWYKSHFRYHANNFRKV